MRLVTIFFVVITILLPRVVYSSLIEEKKTTATLVPLSGTYFIPGDFATLNDAAISLNTNGISGPVVFNVATNHVETAPAGISAGVPGGIIFGNITGTSATNTITFQKNGVGANPLITAGSNHFAGGIMDGVIKIIGSDYLTFDGIDVRENPSNTTSGVSTNNMTEFGYAFFYANTSATADGAQYNTIKNCNITLNTGGTNYQNTFGIFSTTLTTSINGTSSASISVATGSHSNNKLYGNIISNANFGITIIGSNTVAAMDSGWDVGGVSGSTGNIIVNFGIGNGVAASAYQKLGITVQGILINQVADFNISNNTMESSNGTNTTPIVMAGIFIGWSGTMIQSATNTSLCNHNSITITNNLSETTAGIWSRIGNATSSKFFNFNSISITNTSTISVASKFMRGIYQDISIGELITSNNTISLHYENTDHSHAVYFIQADIATPINREANDNIIVTPTGKSLRTSGIVTGISHVGLSSGTLNIKRNTININKGNVSSNTQFSGINSIGVNSNTTVYEIIENTITLRTSSTTNASTVIVGISSNDGTASTNKTISSNTITINGINIGGFSIGLSIGRCGILECNFNSIVLTNYSPNLYGVFLTTGCTINNISSNIITISPIGMPISATIYPINNAIGTPTITSNEIVVAPTVQPLATTTIITQGISNVIANGTISNNSKIHILPSTTESMTVVNFTSTAIVNTAASTHIESNNDIRIASTTLTGVSTTNGINNSGIDSTIINNSIELNITTFSTTIIQGILNSGSGTTISGNNNMNLQLALAGNGTINGINNSGLTCTISNNQNLTATSNSTINFSRVYGINNTGATSQITNNSNIAVSANATLGNTFARGISSSVNSIISGNTSILVNSNAGSISSTQGIYGIGTISFNTITATSSAQTGIDNSAGIYSDGNTTVTNNTVTSNFYTTTGNVIGHGINSNNLFSSVSYNIIDHTSRSNSNDAFLTWTGLISGIRCYGSNTTVNNNQIVKVYGSMGKGTLIFEVAGIVVDNSPGCMISDNIISNVSCNGTADNRTYLSGIYALTGSFNPTIKNNRIFEISFNSSITGVHPGPSYAAGQPIPANTNGIWVRLSFNSTLNTYKIYNNHISRLYNPSASNLGGIFGLALSSREVHHTVYNNTIVIGDNSNIITSNITGDFGAAAVGYLNRVGSGITDLRNNILYVNVMPKGSGFVSALAAIKNHDVDSGTFFINPGQTGVRPTNYHISSNNNLFYAPSVHGRRSYFYCEGNGLGAEYNRFNIDHNTTTINDPNINVMPFVGCTSKYKTLMNGGASNYGTDSNSYYDNVVLTEGSGLEEGYWTPSGETYAELGGQILGGEYDLDSKNVSRGATPDIGAIQFSAQIPIVPNITYDPLLIPGSCGNITNTLSLNNAHIVDTAGVPTAGSLVPRLYYKINAGAYASVPGTLTSGTGFDGYWSFTMTGLSAGTISYYVIAQDRLTKLTSNPSVGLVACSVNNVTSHPTSPSIIIMGGSTAVYSLGAWSSAPLISKAVIFDDDFSSTVSIEACSVIVKSGKTVVFNSSHHLLVQNEITVEAGGTLIFENNSQLVQIANSVNSGNINYKRIATVKKMDYVYWSSPVANFDITNLNSALPTGPKYKWETTLPNVNGGLGNWINAQGNTMSLARGYIVRSPLSFDSTILSPFESTFIGVANNGNIPFTISRGAMTTTTLTSYSSINGIPFTEFDDNWNLIGNPYPSSISANHFLYENRESNGGVLAGFVNIWRHGIDLQTGINNPFYGSFTYNYDSSDYLTYNIVGATCCPTVGDYKIGAGQGFFVQMIEGNPSSGTINFNNTMRRDSNNIPHDNTMFFRSNNSEYNSDNIERHRVWLDLVDSNNNSERTLIGYITGANNSFESYYDVPTGYKSTLDVFSLIDNLHIKTQGRKLPFEISDEVPIGYNAPEDKNYKFAIGAIDGLFETQNIYLKDLDLNITHDLKLSPYEFYSLSGYHNNRFVLVYQNNLLSLPNYFTENTITVYSDNTKIGVKSTHSLLKEIKLFDLQGRLLIKKNPVNSTEFIIYEIMKSNQVLMIKILTEDGIKTIKKIIN